MATAEQIFVRYFLPLYPEDARADLARARATDANPGQNPSITAHLEQAAAIFVARAASSLVGDGGGDLALDYSDASVHRLSAALTLEAIDRLAKEPEELFNVVVHGAAYVGACIVRNHGGAWRVRRPLWESLVALRSRAGEGELAVFHWWLKALGDDTRATTLADRYRAHVEVPCARPEDLPVIAPPDRSLPRIAKAGNKNVRYDVLYKYLKAHLPELKDLGEHFPSPERLDEIALSFLDAKLLGGGRMLLLHGQNKDGVWLFWLSASGFEKSAFFPADAFPEHVVKTSGDKVVVLIAFEKKPITHELLWWGP